MSTSPHYNLGAGFIRFELISDHNWESFVHPEFSNSVGLVRPSNRFELVGMLLYLIARSINFATRASPTKRGSLGARAADFLGVFENGGWWMKSKEFVFFFNFLKT